MAKKTHKRGNGEGSITKRKDGRWVAKIQIGTNPDTGKAIMKSFYGKERKEVVSKLDDYKLMIKSEISVIHKDLLFSKYITDWMENVRVNKLKDGSYDRLYYTVNNNILPYIGHFKLGEINSEMIQRLVINELMNTPSPIYKDKKLSHSTIKKAYNALTSCFEYATSNRHITLNPMNSVELPSIHKFETKIIEIIPDEDVKKIINTSLSKFNNGKYVYAMGAGVVLLFNTGIRIGELLGLKWDKVDFMNKTITICSNVTKTTNKSKKDDTNGKTSTLIQKTVKTQSSNRMIPLNESAIEALNILKSIRYFGENSFVISTATNTVMSPDTFRDIYYRILNKAGVKKYSVHATRHTFASKLFREKQDIKVISQLLGHSSVSITYNTYVHVIEEQKINSVQILDNIGWT